MNRQQSKLQNALKTAILELREWNPDSEAASELEDILNHDTKTQQTTFIKEITVKDPSNGQENPVEIHKDNDSNGIFGISSTFVDQITDEIPSPFNDDVTLKLERPLTEKEQHYKDMTDREAVEYAFGANAFPQEFIQFWEVDGGTTFSSRKHGSEEALQKAKDWCQEKRSEGWTTKRKSYNIGVSVAAVRKRNQQS